MSLPLRCVVFTLCTLFPAGVLCTCETPSAGQCITNNSMHISDREVFSVAAVNCRFQRSLCEYRQGCQDPDSTKWTAQDCHASARQESPGLCGSNSYSVLESRWINFSTSVCLQFSFSRVRPQSLAVFLVSYTDSSDVQQLLGDEDNKAADGHVQNETRTIEQSIGKVVVRLRGGAPNSNEPFLKLFPISSSGGRCETPDCSFSDAADPLCGWRASGWEKRSFKYNQTVVTTNGVATLTSPLTRGTGENRRDCLTFKFRLKQAGDSLNVSVLVSAVSVTVWSSQGENVWTDASVQIVTWDAYQIVFSGRKSTSSAGVTVRGIAFTSGPRSDPSCPTVPEGAAVNVTLPLGSSAGAGNVTLIPGCSSSVPSEPGNTSSSADGAVIGGVVAAVLVVIIIVVVVGVLLYKRRRERKSGNDAGASRDIPAIKVIGAVAGRSERTNDNDYTEIRNSHVLRPTSESHYTAIDDVDITDHVDDVSPYEVAEDGSLRKVHDSGTNINHLNAKKSQTPLASDQSFETGEGDYNISGFQKALESDRGTSDAYSHISSAQASYPAGNSLQKRARATPGNRGQEPKMATTPLYYELAKVETASKSGSQAKANDGYSLVRGRDQTPQAASESAQEGEYSRAAEERHESRETTRGQHSKRGKASIPTESQVSRSRGDTQDDVANHRFVTAVRPEGGPSSQYSLQKPVRELPDDYNTLDFDESRKESAKNDKHGVPHEPYDHVQSDPDDGYNKIQIGKRNIVIDFDYDHVRH